MALELYECRQQLLSDASWARLQERCVCERESCVLSGGEHFQKAPLIICLDACISLFESSGDLITQL